MIEVLADQFRLLTRFVEGRVIKNKELLPIFRSGRTHKFRNKFLRQETKEFMPVDGWIVAKPSNRVFGKRLLVSTDSHRHVSAHGLEHQSHKVGEQLYHRKSLLFISIAPF